MIQTRKNYNQILEIKKGETGTGLLIENDGYIKGTQDAIKQIREDIETKKNFVIPDKFIVNAVFQKYNVKNANGRIYPENVLKPAVDDYIESRVKTRAAIGALDHPACLLEGNRILTETGWVDISLVKRNDKVLTLNDKNEIEINGVYRKIEEYYNGNLILLKHKFLNDKVTEMHKFPVYDINMNFKGFCTAKEIHEKTVEDAENLYLLKTANWKGKKTREYDVKGLNNDEMTHTTIQEFAEDCEYDISLWAKFIALFVTKGKIKGKCIEFKIKAPEVCTVVENIFKEMGLDYSAKTTGFHSFVYTVYDLRLFKHIKLQTNRRRKGVPLEIKKANIDVLKTFFENFLIFYHDKCFDFLHKTGFVVLRDERLAFDINEILFKIGFSAKIKKLGCFFVITPVYHENLIKLSEIETKTEKYSGMVYCVEVKNHTFYNMDSKGNTYWTGNSSTLSGHDVSHLILNLEWDKATLVGEMELHLSEGFKRYGVCSTSGDLVANMLINNILIGVSSRALGTVENKYGDTIVNDDLELIGWDVVMEPSTPGAYIGFKKENLSRYVEGEERKNGVFLNEKIDKIKKILK